MKKNPVSTINLWQHPLSSTILFRQSFLVLTIFFLSLFFLFRPNTAFAIELKLSCIESPSFPAKKTITKPGQIPHSIVTLGKNNIMSAWLAGPTNRYQHGVLGDDLEASILSVVTDSKKHLRFILPQENVFEDLEPRLIDINKDNKDEVMIVESNKNSGASLALYSIVKDQLVKIAATPFIGTANRWLNPVGVGDFDGNGEYEIALVATPHIGGRLQLFKIENRKLILFSEYTGVSTHSIGSTELGLGRVVSSTPKDLLLIPNQAKKALLLLEWKQNEIHEMARVALPGLLKTSLVPLGENHWSFRLTNGKQYELKVVQ